MGHPYRLQPAHWHTVCTQCAGKGSVWPYYYARNGERLKSALAVECRVCTKGIVPFGAMSVLVRVEVDSGCGSSVMGFARKGKDATDFAWDCLYACNGVKAVIVDVDSAIEIVR
jgi:hypothetical protein